MQKSYKTKRCILRPITSKDLQDITYLANNKKIAKNTNTPFPYSIENAKQYLKITRKNHKTNKELNLGIEYEGKIIGMASLMELDNPNNSAELGYWIGEPFQRKGIGTEVVTKLLQIGFKELEKHRIYAIVFEYNIPSQRFHEKLGLRKEAILKQAKKYKSKYYDKIIYAILKSEYKPMNSKK